jgi:D-alanyl-D-alanine carboxypeptidase
MSYREPAPIPGRRIPSSAVAGLLVVVAAVAASLGYPMLSSGSSNLPVVRPDPPAAVGEADGLVPEGTTFFDRGAAAVANLDPDLLRAVRRAAADAARDDIELFVTSGWRSRAYQEQLFAEAVSDYGSAENAARWVAPPGTSIHESGKAIDIGRDDATAWLSEHGARYGLCQVYRNEPWHYELDAGAVDQGCPRMFADPTRDPRMGRVNAPGAPPSSRP